MNFPTVATVWGGCEPRRITVYTWVSVGRNQAVFRNDTVIVSRFANGRKPRLLPECGVCAKIDPFTQHARDVLVHCLHARQQSLAVIFAGPISLTGKRRDELLPIIISIVVEVWSTTHVLGTATSSCFIGLPSATGFDMTEEDVPSHRPSASWASPRDKRVLQVARNA